MILALRAPIPHPLPPSGGRVGGIVPHLDVVCPRGPAFRAMG